MSKKMLDKLAAIGIIRVYDIEFTTISREVWEFSAPENTIGWITRTPSKDRIISCTLGWSYDSDGLKTSSENIAYAAIYRSYKELTRRRK